jgi:hypothetical protein
MYNIPTDNISREFTLCWQAAGDHIQTMGERAIKLLNPKLLMIPPGWNECACIWLKAELRPPFLEHLSFRLGNQLFFIRFEDMEDKLNVPGTRAGLQYIAKACKGHACLMPMLKRDDKWMPAASDWGLTDIPRTKFIPPHPASYGLPVIPTDLVTAEKIEMTDWELQDFAVQVVRNNLPYDKLMSWNTNPEVAPSLWFVGDQGPEWVVIKAVRYPEKDAALPHDIEQIAKNCSRLSRRGNFAVVSVTARGDSFETYGRPIPLYRGHELLFNYNGLRKLKI